MMGSCEKKVAGKGSLQTLLNDEEITPAYRPVVAESFPVMGNFQLPATSFRTHREWCQPGCPPVMVRPLA